MPTAVQTLKMDVKMEKAQHYWRSRKVAKGSHWTLSKASACLHIKGLKQALAREPFHLKIKSQAKEKRKSSSTLERGGGKNSSI